MSSHEGHRSTCLLVILVPSPAQRRLNVLLVIREVYKFNKCLEFSGMMITNEVLALKVTRRGAYTKSEKTGNAGGGGDYTDGLHLFLEPRSHRM